MPLRTATPASGSRFVTRYEDFRARSLRAALRHVALTALGAADTVTGRIGPALAAPRVQFLYLHHVFDDEVDGFRALLGVLARQHRFVSHSEAVELTLSGDIDEPCVAVSFDDGLKNCLRAAEILQEFGASGCFFVCPSIVGETDADVVDRFCAEKLDTPPTEFMNWDDLGALLAAGHEIGSHTMTHSNLAELSSDELDDELGRSFETLTARLGAVRHFAWPYGRFAHFTAEAAERVFRTGYASCASAERGCHVSGPPLRPDEACIRRDHAAAGWPLNHTTWFMARSSRRRSVGSAGRRVR